MDKAAVFTANETSDSQQSQNPKKVFEMTSFKSNCETDSNRPRNPEAIDNSHDPKLRLKILCVGDYSGAFSKGVYIKDYVDESVREIDDNTLKRGFDIYSYPKRLRNTSGDKIGLKILNIDEQERIRWGETCIHDVYRDANGAIVFEGAKSSCMKNAVEWKYQVSQVEHEIPFVFLVDNVFQPPVKWIGQGLLMDSNEEMDNFCQEHGFLSWFEMRERGAGEDSVFARAMTKLVDEIISRKGVAISKKQQEKRLTSSTPRGSQCAVV